MSHYQSLPNGINNLNQLVSNYVGANAFDVVRDIQVNLTWLMDLHRHLHGLRDISLNYPHLHSLSQNIHSLLNVDSNLFHLVSVSKALPEMQKLLPAASTFHEEVEFIRAQVKAGSLTIEEMRETVDARLKGFDELFAEYSDNLNKLLSKAEHRLNELSKKHCKTINDLALPVRTMAEKVEAFEPLFNQTAQDMHKFRNMIAHFMATDAVTLALYTNDVETAKYALKQIKISEGLGNNENINHQRLLKKAYVKPEKAEVPVTCECEV